MNVESGGQLNDVSMMPLQHITEAIRKCYTSLHIIHRIFTSFPCSNG